MKRLVWLVPLIFGAGCAACVEPPPDSSAPELTPSDDLAGLVVLTRWQADRYYDESVELHAVLSPDAEWLEPLTPAGWLTANEYDAWLDHGRWPLPDVGERLDAETVEGEPATLTTWDGGDRILIGEDGVAYATSYDDGVAIYISDEQDAALAAFATGGEVEVELPGGADVAAQIGTTAARLPAPLEVALDPDQVHVVSPDDDLTVEWTPADDGSTIVVTINGLDRGFVERFEDTGSATFSASDIEALGGDFLSVAVARLAESEVQLDEGVLQVRAQDEVFLTYAQVESLGFFPSVALTEQRTVIELYDLEGRFADGATLDLGDGVEVEDLEVESGKVLRAELYLTEDAPTGPHTVSVDTGADVITANSSLLVYHPLPANDDCVSARTGPGLLGGELYYRTNDGLTDLSPNAFECSGLTESWNGVDSYHRITMPPEHLLVVSAISIYGDIMLSLYDTCDSRDDAYLECWDVEGEYDIEFLDYESGDEEETVYLLVDNYIDYLEYDEIYLSVEITPIADMLLTDETAITVGETDVLRLETSGHVWDETAAFDFGPYATVDGYTVVDAQTVDVTVSVDADGVPGDHEVTATQGGSTLVSGNTFDVRGVLPDSDDCAAADANEVLHNAQWEGETTGWTDNGWDQSGCWADDSYGDNVYRIELPSEGSDAFITAYDGGDLGLLLYRECGDTAVPVACIDNNGAGDLEALTFTAGAGESGVYYLVVDMIEPTSDAFQLNIDID